MSLNQFDKSNVRLIISECQAALSAVAERHGLTLTQKNCSYRTDELPVPFKLTILQTNESGETVDPMATDFTLYATSFGLSPDDLGKTFKQFGGQSFKICGLKPRSRKYPIVVQQVGTTKKFKLGAMEVKRYLEMETA